MNAIRKILQRPLFHILIIGSLIAALQYFNRPAEAVFISQQAIAAFEKNIVDAFGQDHKLDRKKLIAHLAEEEILYREARTAGYDQLPSVVTRLANVAHFLQIATEESSVAERYQAALAMKLDETDIVVRRQMITLYKTALKNSGIIEPPSEQAIQHYYQTHSRQFIQPARYAFHHIYLQKSGTKGLEEAQALRLSIVAAADTMAEKTAEQQRRWQVAQGDVFYGGHHFGLQNKKQVAKNFGAHFAEQLAAQTAQQWSQPISSVFGWHLVWIDQYSPEQPQPMDSVRKSIVRSLSSQAEKQRYRERLSALKSRYAVVVEEMETDPPAENNARLGSLSRTTNSGENAQ